MPSPDSETAGLRPEPPPVNDPQDPCILEGAGTARFACPVTIWPPARPPENDRGPDPVWTFHAPAHGFGQPLAGRRLRVGRRPTTLARSVGMDLLPGFASAHGRRVGSHTTVSGSNGQRHRPPANGGPHASEYVARGTRADAPRAIIPASGAEAPPSGTGGHSDRHHFSRRAAGIPHRQRQEAAPDHERRRGSERRARTD